MSTEEHQDVERVRYGRARLTIARSGSLDDERLSKALDAFARGEPRSAAAVARAYVRARIVAHSPSFSWRKARISELIPLVTSVSADPEIEADSSQELAKLLLTLREPAPAATPPGAVTRTPPPQRRKPRTASYALRRAAAVAAVVAIGVGIWLIARGEPGGPAGEAGEYGRAAGAAVTAIADSMDGAFGAFDTYLAGGRAEVVRRAAADAEATIAEQRRSFKESVPTGDGDGEAAARAAADAAADYAEAATGFIERLREVVALERRIAESEALALYRETRRLGKQADALEARVLSLGTGPGDDSGPDHYRPIPPDDLVLR